MIRRSWAVLVVLMGCAGPAVSPVASGDELPDAAKVFAAVSAVRELPSQRVPRVEFLRHREYFAASKDDSEVEGDDLAKHAKRFGLSAQDVEVSDEQARLLGSSGFYKHSDKTIYVLDDPNRRFPALLEQVVAHESVHALQDEHGLLTGEQQRFPIDEGLARRALIEGDATLGMLLYQERDWHTPSRRLAERVRLGFAEEPISRYVQGTTAPGLEGSPAYQQEVLLFPYRGGAAFVGALLGAGGYGLVAQAFAAPPKSTAQVLHPERYARGEQPVPIPSPPLAGGYTLADESVLGELLTRSLLLRCNDDQHAIKAAEGWRGDAVVTLRQGSSEVVAHQWLTDSDHDAHELAAALRVTCRDSPPNPALFVTERGARVVAIRGADTKLAQQLAGAWLSAVLPTPAAVRPLGAIELSAHPAPGRVKKAFVDDGWLKLPAAGVELLQPTGVKVKLGERGALLQSDLHTGFELRLLLGEYFDGAAEQILRDLSRSMELAVAYSNVVRVGRPYRVTVGFAPAVAQNFGHAGTVARGRVIAVKLCEGSGLLSIVQYFGDEKAAQNAALRSLRPLEGSTFCAELQR